MNSEKYLSDIYKDFFGDYEKRKEESKEVINIDYESEISKLLINEESKELLRKIVSYIYNYTSDKRYIPFNISIVSLTEKTLESIVKILKSAINNSKYLSGTKDYELSFYKLEDNPFNKIYSENDIVVLKDLEGLELESVNDKQNKANQFVTKVPTLVSQTAS